MPKLILRQIFTILIQDIGLGLQLLKQTGGALDQRVPIGKAYINAKTPDQTILLFSHPLDEANEIMETLFQIMFGQLGHDHSPDVWDYDPKIQFFPALSGVPIPKTSFGNTNLKIHPTFQTSVIKACC
ncbi:MAG: hypothetical protein U1B83_07560 [Candidatus Cloacimonadaceae bacterium]|nr:hypothetical protein [Candidatus Cloacimonadaceae bacterium]